MSSHCININRQYGNGKTTYKVSHSQRNKDFDRALFIDRCYETTKKTIQVISDATLIVADENNQMLHNLQSSIQILNDRQKQLDDKLDHILNILLYAPPPIGGTEYNKAKDHFEHPE